MDTPESGRYSPRHSGTQVRPIRTTIFMTEAPPPTNQLLQQLKALGAATSMVDVILDLLGHTQFFDDFTHDDILKLAPYLQLYRAGPGDMIIREGDRDDYMLFLLKGRINIVKTDEDGQRRPMTSVGPGATLGEMSMIDGESRFATCIAMDVTTFAVFGRDGMVRIIMEHPALGAKILIRLVTLLSQRLRETSTNLLHYLQRSDAV
jgi:CRP/FNR family cyclic AMP-dependent transcriptional regulator